MLVAATVGMVFMHRNRLLSLILIGIVGLMVSSGLSSSARQILAMTQFTVEVVTIILLLLGAQFLAQQHPCRKHVSAARARYACGDLGGIATFGCPITICCATLLPPDLEFHLANSYKGGGGTNVVNVILVDFRGFDTYGEIIVLGIARC